jgi:hypothetical protein
MSASVIAQQVRKSDFTRLGDLDRATFATRGAADYSGVSCVGIDDTAHRRNQTYISSMADLDGYKGCRSRAGQGQGDAGMLCDQLDEHLGGALAELTCDMA